eukprot:10217613-Ditylum_brightwellii.AAC.2
MHINSQAGGANRQASKEEAGIYCHDNKKSLAVVDEDIIFPTTPALLEGPNVWGADIGASCDSKEIHKGMTNKHVPSNNDGVTLPDGKVKSTTMIADIKGIVCDKNGSKIDNCLIKGVK